MVKSNVNRSVITLVAASLDPIPAGVTCNLWITNDNSALAVSELPETGEIEVDLSGYPDVLKKAKPNRAITSHIWPKRHSPEIMGTVVLEASWSL